MDLNLKLILQAIDRGLVSTLGRSARATGDLSRSTTAAARTVRDLGQATDRETASAGRATRGLAGLFRQLANTTAAQRAEARAALDASRAMDRQEASAGRLRRGLSLGGATRLGRNLLFGGGLFGGLSASALGLGVIKVSSEFERFETILTTVEGSAAKARQSMAWVQQFAQKTPYELAQVMDAFVRLRAYGIDPTDGALRSLGDGASAMGKDVMAAVEMLADAQTGEFERLKEFGIRASQQGNRLTLTYSKAGKDMVVTTTKSAAAIRKAVLGIFDARFQGAMDAQSRTFAGLWSNLMDSWAAFQLEVGRGGVFDFVKGELASLLAEISKASADGRLMRWARQISGSLVEMAKALKDLATKVDWVAFIRGVTSTIQFIDRLVRALGGLRGVVDLAVVTFIVRLGVGIGTVLVPALAALGLAGAPIWLTIAAVTGLAAGAYLLIRNWSKVSAWAANLWASIRTAFTTGVAAVWSGLPEWFRMILRGAAFVLRIASPLGAAAAPASALAGPAPARRTAQIGGARRDPLEGRIDVRVSGDGRPRVTGSRTNAPGLALSTSRGPVTATR